LAADVPFVGDFRRRALENYARAEDSKAMALNVRGIFSVATRRVDDQIARRIALEECNRIVQRDVPVVREFDRCSTYAVGNQVVWSFRPPPLPPPPYVPARPSPPITLDPATVPLMSENARRNLAEHYLKAERKRALVLGRARFEWWAMAETEADAIKRTLQTCGHITGRPCVIYAVDDQVLVRTPQRHRVVDVFTPQHLTDLDAGQQAAVERYLIADDWRAIAVGRNGRLGIVVGRANEAAAASDAVSECTRGGGTDCAVSAMGPFLVAPK
jgi:adenylate cyclase